jgi:hypothetical protein
MGLKFKEKTSKMFIWIVALNGVEALNLRKGN